MAFGTAKNLDASNRFMLVRLEPARNLTDELVSAGSGIYTATLPLWTISRIIRNGDNTITNTSNNPPTANDTYYWNSASGEFKVKLAAAPSYYNVIIMYHWLFYTGEKTRYIRQNPSGVVTSTNLDREWKPRLESYPSITQTARNITAGILSIANTSITVLNADRSFQAYLGSDDSFSNAECKIWLCINDTDAMDLIYDGKVKSLSINSDSVTLSVFDPFVALSQPGLMGDTGDEAYARRKTSSYSSLRPDDHDTPIPFVFGSKTNESISDDVDGVFASSDGESHFVIDARRAMCIDYINVDSYPASPGPPDQEDVNRQWVLCRTTSNGLRTQTLGSITRSSKELVGVYHYYVSGHDIGIGETVICNNAGAPGGVVYGICLWNEDYDISGSTYNLKLYCDDDYVATSFTAHDHPAMFVKQSGDIRPNPIRAVRDYSVTETTTSGGNKVIKVTFTNNFESSATFVGVFGMDSLNPNEDEMYYVARPADVDTHSTALKRIVTASGLTPNDASFTQADSDLDANARFTIPLIDESDYKDYRSYCEEILRSVLGFLKINSSSEAVYEVIAAPSSSDITDTGIYHDKSLTISIDYNDIVTELIGYNPHITDIINLDASQTATESLANTRAKYLHGIDNTLRFKHVLERLDNRIYYLLTARANRRARYSFKTSTKHLDTLIGDDIELQSGIVLGDSGTVDLKVTKITKDGKKTTIVAEDLEGL